MSKSKKILLIALLAVLAAGVLVTVLVSHREKKKEEIQNTDEVIVEVDPETVTALSWNYEGDASSVSDTDSDTESTSDTVSLAFTKTDDGWTYDDDSAFPVSTDKMNDLLSVFESFGASFVIENVEDLSQYGLDSPVGSIKITADGTDYEVTLGTVSTMDAQRYVSIGDGKVYLVSTDPLDSYKVTLPDMIQDDEIPDAISKIDDMTVAGVDDYTVVLDEENTSSYCADDIYFVDGEPLDTDNVDAYLSNVTDITFGDYVTYNATAEELSAYGFDDPDLSVTINYTPESDDEEEDSEADATEPRTFSFTLGRNVEELEAAEADEDGTDTDVTCYIRIGESPIIYTITSDEYDKLTACTKKDLLHQDVFTAGTDEITAMTVTLDGETYTFTSETEDDVTTWKLNDEEVDVTDIESALNSLVVHEFSSAEPTLRQEIGITLTLNDENHPEETIALYRYDGSHCLCQINGTTTCLTGRSTTVDLAEAVYAIVLGQSEADDAD